MDNNIRFGLLGYGHIGKRHANIINQFGTLEAICDTNLTIEQEIPERTRYFSNINDLINEKKYLDAIVICTPNHLHATHTMQCIEGGLHVLCEKPMALSISDCHAMAKLANEKRIYLEIVKQNRYNPYIDILLKATKNGDFGKISSFIINCNWNRNLEYYTSIWKGKEKKDGGIIYTQFSHFIDIIVQIFGKPEKIKGFKENILHDSKIEIEDTIVVSLQYMNKILGSIHLTTNSYKKNMEGSITIIGEKGTLKIGGEYLNRLEYLEIENKSIYQKFDEIKSTYAPADKFFLHKKVYEKFVYNLKRNYKNNKDLKNSIKTIELIDNIYSNISTM